MTDVLQRGLLVLMEAENALSNARPRRRGGFGGGVNTGGGSQPEQRELGDESPRMEAPGAQRQLTDPRAAPNPRSSNRIVLQATFTVYNGRCRSVVGGTRADSGVTGAEHEEADPDCKQQSLRRPVSPKRSTLRGHGRNSSTGLVDAIRPPRGLRSAYQFPTCKCRTTMTTHILPSGI